MGNQKSNASDSDDQMTRCEASVSRFYEQEVRSCCDDKATVVMGACRLAKLRLTLWQQSVKDGHPDRAKDEKNDGLATGHEFCLHAGRRRTPFLDLL